MAVAKIECFAGASGDMFLGAWFNLGVPVDEWRSQLAQLAVNEEYEVTVEAVTKQEIAATRVQVRTQHSHHHRHLPDIARMIDASELPEIVKEKVRRRLPIWLSLRHRFMGRRQTKFTFTKSGLSMPLSTLWAPCWRGTCSVSRIALSLPLKSGRYGPL